MKKEKARAASVLGLCALLLVSSLLQTALAFKQARR